MFGGKSKDLKVSWLLGKLMIIKGTSQPEGNMKNYSLEAVASPA